MCDAKMLGIASLGTQLIGGIMGAKGTYDQTSAQKSTLATQAAIARRNAEVSQQQANIALENGRVTEQAARLRTSQMAGTQRASLAANGVDLGEGSANDVLTTTAFMGERDALTIRDNATRQAWAYQVQASNNLTEAGLMQSASNNINPGLSTAGSLLSTAGGVASSWYKLSKEGAFSGTSKSSNYQIGTPEYSGNFLMYDA